MNRSTVEEARFSERMREVPKRVYEALRLDFGDSLPNGKQLWHDLMKHKRKSMPSRASLLIINHIGCTLEELMNPDVDLLMIYIERKHNLEKQALAAKYGMKAA